MKTNRLLLPLILAASAAAHAAGPLDGIYDCNLWQGGQIMDRQYVTVNTNAAGASIWAVAATASTQRWAGYGIGTVQLDGRFIGDKFTFTSTPAALNGTIYLAVNGIDVGFSVACVKVW